MACPSFRASWNWAAPYREWCSHFHHNMALESQLNILKESVGLVISKPRHFWDCKWKSRCWDTHFHNMSSVMSQSCATIQSFSGLMHLPVFSLTIMNGSLPESRQTVKEDVSGFWIMWLMCLDPCLLRRVWAPLDHSRPPSCINSNVLTTQGQRTMVASGAVQCGRRAWSLEPISLGS